MAERYTPKGTPLNDYERELLVILMEECAEVILAASKLIRFGKERRPRTKVLNSVFLAHEIGDTEYIMQMVQESGIVQAVDILGGKIHKREKLAKFMQTSRTP